MVVKRFTKNHSSGPNTRHLQRIRTATSTESVAQITTEINSVSRMAGRTDYLRAFVLLLRIFIDLYFSIISKINDAPVDVIAGHAKKKIKSSGSSWDPNFWLKMPGTFHKPQWRPFPVSGKGASKDHWNKSKAKS